MISHKLYILNSNDSIQKNFSLLEDKYMLIDGRDTTFLMTTYLDSPDRFLNTTTNIDYLRYICDTNIHLVEYSEQPHEDEYDVDKYEWFDIFSIDYWHRPKILNNMAEKVETINLAILDVDILLQRHQLVQALNEMHTIDLLLPYNGEYLEMTKEAVDLFIKHYDLNIPSLTKMCKQRFNIDDYLGVGGCMFFKTDVYMEGGGENEYFKGWGCEDEEIYERFFRLGYNVAHLRDCGPIHHMYHPRRKEDSVKAPWYQDHINERNRIRSMERWQLRKEVEEWKKTRTS